MEKIRHFLFINSGIRQTIIKNTFWAALGSTLAKVIRVIVIIYAARILGTDDYGIFTYAMSLVGVFTIFSDIGLTNILTKELARLDSEKREFLSTAFVVKLTMVVVSFILIAAVAPLISKFEASRPLLIIIGITIIFESLQGFLYAITRSQNRMEVEAGLSIITEVLTTILVLSLFIKYPSVKSLATAYMIGNGLGFIITLFSLRKNIDNIFKYFKKQLIKPIAIASWPFAVMGISSIFMTNIDSIIIGIYKNSHVLGLYAAAQKPIGLLRILPNFLGIGLFPIINKFSHNQEDKKLSDLIKRSCLFSLAIALPIVVGGIIIAGPLITVTFGYQFIGATLTFQILLLSLLMVFPGSILADLILAKDRQKIFIKSSFFGALTNITLDLLLIPTYGINGSAIATLVAVFVVNGIFFVEAQRGSKMVGLIGGTKKITAATIIMGIFAYIMIILSAPLLLIIILSALLYLGLLLVMKEQIIEDIKLTFWPTTKEEKTF